MSLPDSFRPLVRDDFAFHGFDDLVAPLERTLGAIGIRDREPSVTVVESAVFVPAFRAPLADGSQGRFAVEGGIVTRDGRSLDEARVRRRGTRWGTRVLGGVSDPAAAAPVRTVDDEVVYLGWYFDQFGHFLLESLARAWMLDEIPSSVRVVFHSLRDVTPIGTRRRILEAFGVPVDRILVLDEPTRLNRIIIPEPLFEISTSADVRMPEPFRKVAARIADAAGPTEQPVYFSRRLLPSQLRQIVGENELEDVLRENGFLIVHPEMMTFEDQLNVLNRHTHIFTTAGSAAHAVLFARTNPSLHLLTDGIPREDYFLAPKVANATTTYVNCLGRGDRAVIDNRSPLLVTMPDIIEYLDEHGFLKRRVRSAITVRLPTKSDIYLEAWLYAAVLDVLPHGESLSVEIEHEALARADSSWPLSWILARYFARADTRRVDELVHGFARLVAMESDLSRLARYHADVESMSARVGKVCGAEATDQLVKTLADTFGITSTNRVRKHAVAQVQ